MVSLVSGLSLLITTASGCCSCACCAFLYLFWPCLGCLWALPCCFFAAVCWGMVPCVAYFGLFGGNKKCDRTEKVKVSPASNDSLSTPKEETEHLDPIENNVSEKNDGEEDCKSTKKETVNEEMVPLINKEDCSISNDPKSAGVLTEEAKSEELKDALFDTEPKLIQEPEDRDDEEVLETIEENDQPRVIEIPVVPADTEEDEKEQEDTKPKEDEESNDAIHDSDLIQDDFEKIEQMEEEMKKKASARINIKDDFEKIVQMENESKFNTNINIKDDFEKIEKMADLEKNDEVEEDEGICITSPESENPTFINE